MLLGLIVIFLFELFLDYSEFSTHFLAFQLIVMLCIIDSIFAGFSFIEYGLKKGFKLISYTTPIYVNLWPKVVYPLHNVTYTMSLFVTLAIAIER